MYDKKKIALGSGVAYGVLALLVLSTLYFGTVVAYPIAGVGNFTVETSNVTAENVYIHPGASQTSIPTTGPTQYDSYPSLVLELSAVQFDDIILSKDIDISSVGPLTGTAKIRLEGSESFDTRNLIFKASSLSAETSEFNGFILDESDDPRSVGNEDVRRELFIAAGTASEAITPRNLTNQTTGGTLDLTPNKPGLTLGIVEIQAQYLAADSVPLQGVSLGVWYDPDDDGTYEYQF